MDQRALITGISGFVGGFLAEHLLGCGDQVLGTSPDGRWTDISPTTIRNRVELIAWDFSHASSNDDSVRDRIASYEPTAIYHLAALSVPRLCGDEAPTPLALAVNVEGTRRVVRLAAALPKPPRVLLISSSHVYAPIAPPNPRVDEQAPVAPRRGYGQTKRAAELVLHDAVGQGLCDGLVARAFQHTGPRQQPQMMLPEWAQQVARGGNDPVKVHTRDAIVDVTDVRDIVRAYRLLVEHGESGGTYNVGSGVARRSGDLLELLLRLAEAPTRPIRETRPGPKQDPIANIDRLAERTGWHARVSMEQTISDTLDYWRHRVGGSA